MFSDDNEPRAMNLGMGGLSAETLPPSRVLAAFPAARDVGRIESMGNAGGFSGAALWRLHTPTARLCLRQWPAEHPDQDTLRTIHALLYHVTRQDFTLVPKPLPTISGTTWLEWGGRFWELTAWLPGEALYHANPTETKLIAALEALARFHQASESFWTPRPAPSLGVRRRADQLRCFLERQIDVLPDALRKSAWPEFRRRGRPLLAQVSRIGPGLLDELESWKQRPVTVQYVLRDIWHDHVLFQGETVSGIVDFGAVRVDIPCGDVSRLLGSLVHDDSSGWTVGLRAYHALRPLTADDRQLIPLWDRSGIVLGVINWLVWLALDQRIFDDSARVLQRLDELTLRLSHALQTPPRNTFPPPSFR